MLSDDDIDRLRRNVIRRRKPLSPEKLEAINRDREERKREAWIKALSESADFQRAYDLHGDFYEGREVSDEDQKWFDNYYRELSKENSEKLHSFGISLYLVYWAKYVTRSEDA